MGLKLFCLLNCLTKYPCECYPDLSRPHLTLPGLLSSPGAWMCSSGATTASSSSVLRGSLTLQSEVKLFYFIYFILFYFWPLFSKILIVPVVTPPVSPGVEEAEVSLSEVQQVVMQLRGALSLASG